MIFVIQRDGTKQREQIKSFQKDEPLQLESDEIEPLKEYIKAEISSKNAYAMISHGSCTSPDILLELLRKLEELK